MKTLKGLLAFALIGMSVSPVHAGREGRGWVVTPVTGTAITIANTEGKNIFVKGVSMSSATAGDSVYCQLFSTVPTPVTGSGVSLFPQQPFISTGAVSPALVFNTTTTVTNTGANINNAWYPAGDCDNCYLEVKKGGALHMRKSAEASGGANQAWVIWSY